jgi:hypothetical protein
VVLNSAAVLLPDQLVLALVADGGLTLPGCESVGGDGSSSVGLALGLFESLDFAGF